MNLSGDINWYGFRLSRKQGPVWTCCFGFGPSNSFGYYKYINLYSEVMQCQIITLMFCRKITSIFAIY